MSEQLQTENTQDLPQMTRIASARSKVHTNDYIFPQQITSRNQRKNILDDLLTHLSANIKILLDKLLAI